MAAISLFWYTNMAAVTSDENDLLVALAKVQLNTHMTMNRPFFLHKPRQKHR
jgi:hypothetical protein